MTKADMAIDLGSANIRIWAKNELVFDEPSIVAINQTNSKIIEVGYRAKEVVGNGPGYIAIFRPLKSGVVTDYNIAKEMLKLIFKRLKKFRRPNVSLCIPNDATQLEQKVLLKLLTEAGAKSVSLIKHAIAQCRYFNLAIEEPFGFLIIDLGAGMTQITVVAMGKMVLSNTERLGTFELDDQLNNYLKRTYKVTLVEKTIEELKKLLLNAFEPSEEICADVLGHDLDSAKERKITVNQLELYLAIQSYLSTVVKSIKTVLTNTPSELVGDLISTGAYLTGGGSLINNLTKFLSRELNLEFNVADNPLHATIIGAAKMLSSYPLGI